MRLEIRCPKCKATSVIAYSKVPPGTLKTKCNKCQHQFPINKQKELNCRTMANEVKVDARTYDTSGWKVKHAACQGMDYELNALGPLIKSGLLLDTTQVLPPGESQWKEAAQVNQLMKFFEQAREEAMKSQRLKL